MFALSIFSSDSAGSLRLNAVVVARTAEVHPTRGQRANEPRYPHQLWRFPAYKEAGTV